ncbi:MAG: right-handed parallel beta-helix repeat-containing protein [Ferruginibacter sp.]
MKFFLHCKSARLFNFSLLFMLPVFVQAAIRYVKPTATGTGTGLSWANASGDLQAMITASSSGDEVWVMQGIHYPTRLATTGAVSVGNRGDAYVLKAGVSVYGGFLGTELIRSLRNYTSNVTTLSGDIGTPITKTDNCYHVVIAAGPISGNGLLDGFTISNGYANAALANTVNAQANGVVHNRGGGIYIINASPSIKNCIIWRNEALNGVGGGGIFSNSTASPIINNCSINSNSTTGAGSNGAGVYFASTAGTISTCTFTSNGSSAEGGGLYIATTGAPAVTDCDFTSNTSVSNGGGLCNYSSAAINIADCDFTSNAAPDGAGLYNQAASPVISNCNFLSNTASSGGGGIRNYSNASPTVTDCEFTGNTGGSYGGAMYNTSSSPIITNCSFSSNAVTIAGSNLGGGGICNTSCTNVAISNCTFTSNTSTPNLGGGILDYTSSDTHISACTFTFNSAVHGAGIFIKNSNNTLVETSAFLSNTATGGGGAIYNTAIISTFTNCKLLGNVADHGGGMAFLSTTITQVTNCLITGNKAANGAGIFSNNSSSNSFSNCTIASNLATTSGGALQQVNTVNATIRTSTLNNCIIWGNSAVANNHIQVVSGVVNVTYSDIQGGYTGTGNINSDPLFVSPQLASAAPIITGDYRLQKCSPAINAGDNSAIPSGITTDLDATTRKVFFTVDLGAYEYHTSFAIPDAAGIVYVDETKNGDGSSWINALTELADALIAAKYNTSITQIWVVKGTYYPKYNAADGASLFCSNTNRNNAFVLVNNVKVYGGFAGTETLTSQRNWTTNVSTLSGAIGTLNDISDNSYHVVISTGAVGTATLDGFSVISGNANGFSFITSNSTTLEQQYGGAMFIRSSSPLVSNCKFSNNTAYAAGALRLNSSATTIANCIITGNTSTNSVGGGIYLNSSSSSFITNCTIAGNRAYEGGGIAIQSSNNAVSNTIVWGNIATGPLLSHNIYIQSSTPIISYSDIEGGYAGNINADPLFVNPQLASAAPTILGDYHLQRCSPAINSGNNTGVTAADLDGNPRIFNTTVDIGAYEVQYALASTSGIVYVDATKNGDGKTWATAVPEFGDALKASKYNSSITQIWVAKGTYYPLYDAATSGCSPTDNRDKSFVLVNNVKVYGGFAGGETDTTGRNFVTNETILSGDLDNDGDISDNAYHVLISAGAVGVSELDGFTITKGNANGTSDITVNGNITDRVRGGGISSLSSSPSIRNCKFSFNAASSGGAIAHLTANSIITNCSFLSNTAINGGAIDNYLASSTTITNCMFSLNTATSAGGIMNSGGSNISLTNCTFSANTAVNGGGLYNHASTTAIITNCLFSGNNSTNGGGMYIRSSSPQINNSTFSGNLASTAGGGIYNNNSSPVIKNSIVWGNMATTNNAISILSGIPVINNSIVEGGYIGGTNIIDKNPMFLNPIAASNAPTTLGNYRLGPCSPAINIGNNTNVPGGISADLEGNPRIMFTDVDMGAYEVQAIDFTSTSWQGRNTNWNDKINWCGGYVPIATTSVTIPGSLSNYPVIAASFTNEVKNISLANASSLTLNSTAKLTINGTYTNSGSTITNNGTWVMAGNAATQIFPGAAGNITAMHNLQINNPNGIKLNKSFSITGSLIPTAGNINLDNDTITLKSTSTGTASLDVIQPAASISYTGTGKFEVQRFINTGTGPGEHSKSWQFLAAPVTGQSIFQSWQENGLTPTGFGTWITGTGSGFDATTTTASVKYYDIATSAYKAVTSTANPLLNKLGYMLFVRGDRTVVTSGGLPNNTCMRSRGQVYSPSNPPPSVTVPANSFQTFGNPYPSRIEFSTVRAASSGINDVFYVWDPKLAGTYNLGGWQTISGIAGYIPTVGVPPSGNPATIIYPAGVPAPFIESGMAVFVKGNGTGGAISFNENCKSDSSRLVTRQNDNGNNLVDRQWLYASLFTNTGEIADGNIIAFDDGLGNNVNEYDATKIVNGGENFGIIRDENILAVEAREPLAVTDTIFYYTTNLRQQPYQLRFAPVNMSSVNLQAFLIDRYTNVNLPLLLTDSTYVDFNVTEDAGSSAPGRFIIVFAPLIPLDVTFEDIKAWRHEQNINVEWHIQNETNTLLYYVERSGDGSQFTPIGKMQPKNNNGGAAYYIWPDTKPLSKGNFYRIKSIDHNGDAQYSRIVKVLFIDKPAGIEVYPNPVTNGKIQLWFIGMPEGIYVVNIFNAQGQCLFKKQLLHQGGTNMETVTPAVYFAHGNYQLLITGPGNTKITDKIIY